MKAKNGRGNKGAVIEAIKDITPRSSGFIPDPSLVSDQITPLKKTKRRLSLRRDEAFHLAILTNSISKKLNTKVQINRMGKKWKIVIEFIGENELHRVTSLLNGKNWR